ncbi:hypothetical protein IE985_02560 [Klebsiella pneumoniae]|nr:hypothetical protein [Klebsiella pneumoniae]
MPMIMPTVTGEDWHQHDCAQLLHILSGVVRVATPVGYWVVPPGRGVWLPAERRTRCA